MSVIKISNIYTCNYRKSFIKIMENFNIRIVLTAIRMSLCACEKNIQACCLIRGHSGDTLCFVTEEETADEQ